MLQHLLFCIIDGLFGLLLFFGIVEIFFPGHPGIASEGFTDGFAKLFDVVHKPLTHIIE